MSEDRCIDTEKRMKDLLSRLSFRPVSLPILQTWKLRTVYAPLNEPIGWLVTCVFEMPGAHPITRVVHGWPEYVPMDSFAMPVIRRLRRACLELLERELDQRLLYDSDTTEERLPSPYHHYPVFDPDSTLADAMAPHVKRYIDSIP